MHKMPLYNGASLSAETSSWAIMQFAISNKLTYSAISEPLELIKLHCPASNSCVRSLYMLKKQFNQHSECQTFNYSSKCMAELDIKAKCCSRWACIAARAVCSHLTWRHKIGENTYIVAKLKYRVVAKHNSQWSWCKTWKWRTSCLCQNEKE